MLPDHARQQIEAAISDALRSRGMSPHDGYARIQVSVLQRLFAVADAHEASLLAEYKRGYTAGRHGAERDQLLCLVRIREIVGDSTGVLTQDELVARIDGLRFVAAHSKSQHSAAASPAVRVEGGE